MGSVLARLTWGHIWLREIKTKLRELPFLTNQWVISDRIFVMTRKITLSLLITFQEPSWMTTQRTSVPAFSPQELSEMLMRLPRCWVSPRHSHWVSIKNSRIEREDKNHATSSLEWTTLMASEWRNLTSISLQAKTQEQTTTLTMNTDSIEQAKKTDHQDQRPQQAHSSSWDLKFLSIHKWTTPSLWLAKRGNNQNQDNICLIEQES